MDELEDGGGWRVALVGEDMLGQCRDLGVLIRSEWELWLRSTLEQARGFGNSYRTGNCPMDAGGRDRAYNSRSKIVV